MRYQNTLLNAILSIAVAFTSANNSLAAITIVNAGFEGATRYGQINFNGNTVPGWIVPGNTNTSQAGNANNSYAMVFNSSNAKTGVNTVFGTNNLALWDSTNNAGAGGSAITASPNGGDFIGIDGNFGNRNTAIQQSLTGLVVGGKYDISFYAGFGQQKGFDGDTRQRWDVSLGSETWSTPTLLVPNHTFTGWQSYSHTFTATSTSALLKFAAWGNLPIPPFALLDGISVTEVAAVPEPASIAIMGLCITGLGVVRRIRRPAKIQA
jgi:hypothetical protein